MCLPKLQRKYRDLATVIRALDLKEEAELQRSLVPIVAVASASPTEVEVEGAHLLRGINN